MGIREKLAKYGHLMHKGGQVIGAGGNISVKDDDILVIKKKSTKMYDEDKDNYMKIDLKEAEKGDNENLSSETPLHIACYNAREDISAVIHGHSPYVIAAASRIAKLEGNSYEFDCIIEKDVPVIDFIKPGSKELGAAVAEKLKEGATCVMLKRHGAITVGKDIEQAYLRTLALERACITFLNS